YYARGRRRAVLRELLAALKNRGGQVDRLRQGQDGERAVLGLRHGAHRRGVPRRVPRRVRDDPVLQGVVHIGGGRIGGGARPPGGGRRGARGRVRRELPARAARGGAAVRHRPRGA